MITATKTFSIDMAHVLEGHEGLCSNLHGHTYKIEVTAQRPRCEDVILDGPSEGMVVDFKDLKRAVNACIADKYDHCCVIYTKSRGAFEHELRELLKKYHKKIVEVDYRPTAEHYATYWLEELQMYLIDNKMDWVITSVKVWETPTSYAEAQ